MRVTRTDFLDHEQPDDRTLVVVFLRGGADGLTLVPPHGDDAYYSARPTLAVPKSSVLDLDGRFGLHESLRPLLPAWERGELRIVHGAGTEDESRSHFEAQDFLEHGGAHGAGWLARYLRARPGAPGPLASVAIGTTLPESLRGAPTGVVVQRVRDFSILDDDPAVLASIGALYAEDSSILGAAGRATLEAERKLRGIRSEPDAARTDYPDTVLGRGLREISKLIKADVGLVATTVDAVGGALGWDTHFLQNAAIPSLIDDLGRSLAAFREDLGEWRSRVTVVAVTEFGRRVAENTSFGSDHGRGSVMFVLGEGIPGGGGITAEYPSLDPRNLVGPGDVPVATNVREVLAPLLSSLSPGLDLSRVFFDR